MRTDGLASYTHTSSSVSGPLPSRQAQTFQISWQARDETNVPIAGRACTKITFLIQTRGEIGIQSLRIKPGNKARPRLTSRAFPDTSKWKRVSSTTGMPSLSSEILSMGLIDTAYFLLLLQPNPIVIVAYRMGYHIPIQLKV